jgi:hypothetical protein
VATTILEMPAGDASRVHVSHRRGRVDGVRHPPKGLEHPRLKVGRPPWRRSHARPSPDDCQSMQQTSDGSMSVAVSPERRSST